MRTTLESVAKLQGLDAVEVIVVDNGSNDETKEVYRAFHASIKSLIYDYDETPGLLTGRHKGTSLAHASILSFIDDDVELNPEWSLEIRRAFERNSDINFVTGPCLPKYEYESPEWLKYFWTFMDNGHKYCPWLSLMDEGESDHDIDPTSVWGLNFSIKKNALLELGGFHPDITPVALQKFQGDGETGLTLKARENGYRARYVSGARLHHLVPRERMTLGYFKKRFFYQGVCDSYTWLRRKHGLYASEKKQIENPATDRKQGTIFRLYNKFANRVKSGMENISVKKKNASADERGIRKRFCISPTRI